MKCLHFVFWGPYTASVMVWTTVHYWRPPWDLISTVIWISIYPPILLLHIKKLWYLSLLKNDLTTKLNVSQWTVKWHQGQMTYSTHLQWRSSYRLVYAFLYKYFISTNSSITCGYSPWQNLIIFEHTNILTNITMYKLYIIIVGDYLQF